MPTEPCRSCLPGRVVRQRACQTAPLARQETTPFHHPRWARPIASLAMSRFPTPCGVCCSHLPHLGACRALSATRCAPLRRSRRTASRCSWKSASHFGGARIAPIYRSGFRQGSQCAARHCPVTRGGIGGCRNRPLSTPSHRNGCAQTCAPLREGARRGGHAARSRRSTSLRCTATAWPGRAG